MCLQADRYRVETALESVVAYYFCCCCCCLGLTSTLLQCEVKQ